jgi:hypothetical protein
MLIELRAQHKGRFEGIRTQDDSPPLEFAVSVDPFTRRTSDDRHESPMMGLMTHNVDL